MKLVVKKETENSAGQSSREKREWWWSELQSNKYRCAEEVSFTYLQYNLSTVSHR